MENEIYPAGSWVARGSRRKTVRQAAMLVLVLGAGSACPHLTVAAELKPDDATLTLNEAVATALVNSPDLAAVELEVRVRDAQALQAGLAPNPSLSGEVEDVAGSGERSGWESGQTTLSVGQLLELGGKRAKRRHAAELDRQRAGWDQEAKRLTVMSEVAKAFVATLSAQERLKLADELSDIAIDSLSAVDVSIRAGAVSPVERQRASLAAQRARLDGVARARDLATARAYLVRSIGHALRFERVEGDLTRIEPPPPLEKLAALLAENPELAGWTTERERRAAVLAMERSRRVPDVNVSVGGRHFADSDDGALVFGFTVPLPLIDRNQGNVAAAERALDQASVEGDAAVLTVQTELSVAHSTAQSAYDEATSLREELLPEAHRAYAGASDAYSRGLFRYLEVLDAQRTLFELRDRYLDVLAQYHQAVADVERLTGRSLIGSSDQGEDGHEQ